MDRIIEDDWRIVAIVNVMICKPPYLSWILSGAELYFNVNATMM